MLICNMLATPKSPVACEQRVTPDLFKSLPYYQVFALWRHGPGGWSALRKIYNAHYEPELNAYTTETWTESELVALQRLKDPQVLVGLINKELIMATKLLMDIDDSYFRLEVPLELAGLLAES
jgi:hypothetical protein